MVGGFAFNGGDLPSIGAITTNINSASATTNVDTGYQLTLTETSALGANKGGGIAFQAVYDGSNNIATIAGIKGLRDNATSGSLLGYLSFYTRPGATNAEVMRITSAGNVGIGTTSPAQGKEHIFVGASGASSYLPSVTGLAIESNGTNALQFLNTNSSGAYIFFGDPQLATAGYINYEHSTDQLYFKSAGTYAFAAGNVGIGNTAPSYRLDLATYNAEFQADSIRLGAYNGPGGGGGTAYGGGLIFQPYYSGYTKKSAGILSAAESNYFSSGLAFFTNPNDDATSNWVEAMRISHHGNVGIGTTSDPNISDASSVVKLFINGDQHFTRQSAKIYFGDVTAANPLSIGEGLQEDSGLDKDFMSIYPRSKLVIPVGNVGIGTTAPAAKLNVIGTIQIGGDTGAGSTAVYLGKLCGGCANGCSYLVDGYLGWNDTTDTLQGADVIGKDAAFDAGCYMHSVDNIYCGAITDNYCYPIIFSVRFG